MFCDPTISAVALPLIMETCFSSPFSLLPYLARNIDLAAVGGIYPNKTLAKIYLDASNHTETEIQEQKGQKPDMIDLPKKLC